MSFLDIDWGFESRWDRTRTVFGTDPCQTTTLQSCRLRTLITRLGFSMTARNSEAKPRALWVPNRHD